MDLLRSQDFKDILQVMTILNSSLDKDDFRDRLLDSFLRIFHMENSIFFLADQHSNLTDHPEGGAAPFLVSGVQLVQFSAVS